MLAIKKSTLISVYSVLLIVIPFELQAAELTTMSSSSLLAESDKNWDIEFKIRVGGGGFKNLSQEEDSGPYKFNDSEGAFGGCISAGVRYRRLKLCIEGKGLLDHAPKMTLFPNYADLWVIGAKLGVNMLTPRMSLRVAPQIGCYYFHESATVKKEGPDHMFHEIVWESKRSAYGFSYGIEVVKRALFKEVSFEFSYIHHQIEEPTDYYSPVVYFPVEISPPGKTWEKPLPLGLGLEYWAAKGLLKGWLLFIQLGEWPL